MIAKNALIIIIFYLYNLCVNITLGRITEKIELPRVSPGTSRYFLLHRWGNSGHRRAYIQASLHADEIPGLLVANHLIRMIDAAEKRGDILTL